MVCPVENSNLLDQLVEMTIQFNIAMELTHKNFQHTQLTPQRIFGPEVACVDSVQRELCMRGPAARERPHFP
jgi:hypothetical protein